MYEKINGSTKKGKKTKVYRNLIFIVLFHSSLCMSVCMWQRISQRWRQTIQQIKINHNNDDKDGTLTIMKLVPLLLFFTPFQSIIKLEYRLLLEFCWWWRVDRSRTTTIPCQHLWPSSSSCVTTSWSMLMMSVGATWYIWWSHKNIRDLYQEAPAWCISFFSASLPQNYITFKSASLLIVAARHDTKKEVNTTLRLWVKQKYWANPATFFQSRFLLCKFFFSLSISPSRSSRSWATTAQDELCLSSLISDPHIHGPTTTCGHGVLYYHITYHALAFSM